MQNREQNIDLAGIAHPAAVDRDHPPTPAGHQCDFGAVCRPGEHAIFKMAEQPLAFPRNEDRYRLVFLGLQCPHDIRRRHDGDVVFGRAAAEENGDARLAAGRCHENPQNNLVSK